MNKSSASLYAFEGQQDLASPQLVYYPALIRQNIQKFFRSHVGVCHIIFKSIIQHLDIF